MPNLLPAGYRKAVVSYAKFRKDKRSLKVRFVCEFPSDGKTDSVSEILTCGNDSDATWPVHPDLKKAFDRLALHVLFKTDFLEAGKYVDSDIFNEMEIYLDEHDKKNVPHNILSERIKDLLGRLTVNGLSLSGDLQPDSIVIMCTKYNEDGMAFSLNTPLLDIYSENYDFQRELEQAVTAAHSEVLQYAEGKCASNGQMDIFDVLTPVKKVKKVPGQTDIEDMIHQEEEMPFGPEDEVPAAIEDDGDFI